MMENNEIASQIVKACKRLDEKNLIGALEGNVSAKFGNKIYCTPAGPFKADLTADQIVECDTDGRPRGGKPSSEIRLHLAAYRSQPRCQAVVHAHPIYATILACKNIPLAFDLVAEAAYILGPVAQTRFYMPGTDEVFDAVQEAFKDHETVLLANHGAVTTGATMDEALAKMETLERVAQMELIAFGNDNIRRLPRSTIDEIMKLRSNSRHGL